jgi:hypothetical protein
MKNSKTRLFVKNGNRGLDIFLDVSGTSHYLTTHSRCGLLYRWLRNGKTLGELSRIKPSDSRSRQKILHYAQHLVKVAEDYIKYDLAA